MSSPFGQTALTFSSITHELRNTFENCNDRRTGKNSRYTMADAGLSAFSAFFMQSPSFLEHQRTMQDTQGKNNVQTLFGAFEIPTDNHIRSLLDAVKPESLSPMFGFVFDGLNQAGIVDNFRHINQTLLLALDGTEYFSSQKIHCACCSTQQHSNGRITYSHKVVTPVLVSPANDKVIPLAPEFITPQDGHGKQDCELAASRRWLARWGGQMAPLGVTVLADDLYCHEPFCRELIEQGFDFVLTCKPDSHQELYEWVDFLEKSGGVKTHVVRWWTGKTYQTDTYRFVNEVPLRAGKDALKVNWCELLSTNDDGKVIYRGSFATTYRIDAGNVADIVVAGRSRWKIENENNNTLKTKGYHFEHNFGHGQQYLAAVLATLILLACLLHNVLEWMDGNYVLLRQKVPSRQRLFNDIRALTTYFCFDSWEALVAFMLEGWSQAEKTGRKAKLKPRRRAIPSSAAVP